MNILLLIVTALVFIILMRLAFRKLLDLPNYSGKSLLSQPAIDHIMAEDDFWKIINESKRHSKGNYVLQCKLLSEYLTLLSEDDIIQFDRTFTSLMARSYSFRLWEAAYALNGGCSDDAFEYFRTWLIGQGRNKFYWTIKYPRLLLLVGVKELIEEYEGLAYCAYQAYQNKTGHDIPQHDDIEYADKGKIFNENLAFLHYPELALLAW